ncbi:MAG: GNAT family N-acetyltransferase [Nitrospinae bacterium]|nr:GNAT family N-acetyltransferase [Nitrospinota bacterium]MZH03921.1 GNAT family N-acetyltransferase [Nitrospinota bacterium]MZH13891.1 GNAT family N-acetyltransferase [Nitrospinota bacterium]
MTSELTDILGPFPNLRLSKADKLLFRQFLYMEPNLVSLVGDGNVEEEILVLYNQDQPVGTASIVIRKNLNKSVLPDHYARLDVIIVGKKYRNLGIGRLLIVCALIYILRNFGKQIYSLSCLAAHDTVKKKLKNLSFVEHHATEKNFWQGALNLEENKLEDLLELFQEDAKKCLQWTAYKLRNRDCAK